MGSLIQGNQNVTLVDKVENDILSYFKEKKLRVGDSIPNELELTATLGVARNVVREALSRLKMMGLIVSHTRRGMVLKEPSIFGGMSRVMDPHIMSRESLLDLLGFRVALEIGISSDIFHNITDKNIKELDAIVQTGIVLGNNQYANYSEYAFHSKLYEITRNKTIAQFQSIIHPVIEFVKTDVRDVVDAINIELKVKGQIVTHADLLEYLKNRDEKGYQEAIEKHFYVYKSLIYNR